MSQNLLFLILIHTQIFYFLCHFLNILPNQNKNVSLHNASLIQYHKISEALGGHGEYVQTAAELKPALDRAWDVAIKTRLPTVINCQAKKEFWLGGSKWGPGMLGKIEPGCMSYNH